MNRAVAVAEWQGPDAGLAVLQAVAPPAWLAGSYLWDAVLADLHRRAGHADIAHQHARRAIGVGADRGRTADPPPQARTFSLTVT